MGAWIIEMPLTSLRAMTFHTRRATPMPICGTNMLNGIAYGLVQPSGPVVVV